MLRMLLNHAVEIGWRSDNPTAAIKKMRTGSQGFHTWTEAELAAFFSHHEIGSTAHSAVTLMLYTGCSRVDAVRLGWQNVSGSRIQYRRQKTERFSEVVVDIPIHPDLQKVLDTLPKSQMTFLETSSGRSRSANGLGNAMRKWCKRRQNCPTALLTVCARLVPHDWLRPGHQNARSWLGRVTRRPQMVQIYAGKARRGPHGRSGVCQATAERNGFRN